MSFSCSASRSSFVSWGMFNLRVRHPEGRERACAFTSMRADLKDLVFAMILRINTRSLTPNPCALPIHAKNRRGTGPESARGLTEFGMTIHAGWRFHPGTNFVSNLEKKMRKLLSLEGAFGFNERMHREECKDQSYGSHYPKSLPVRKVVKAVMVVQVPSTVAGKHQKDQSSSLEIKRVKRAAHGDDERFSAGKDRIEQ